MWSRLLVICAVLAAALAGWALLAPSLSRDDPGGVRPPPPEVVLFNWRDYTDREVLDRFEAETGLHVVLREYETTDMALAQLQTNPGVCDLFVSDHELAELLAEIRLIVPFDTGRLAHFPLVEGFRPDLRNLAIPYLWGTTGLAVNTARVTERPVRWSMLWDPRYRDRILLLDDLRDATNAILLAGGRSINDRGPEAFDELLTRGLALRDNGVEYGETFDNIRRLVAGEKWISQAFSGDFLLAAGNAADLEFVLPEEGFPRWLDCLFLSADARNPEGAHRLVDFLLRPENSARAAAKLFYASPVRGAERHLDPALLANPVIHPAPGVLERGEYNRPSDETTRELSRIFGLIRSRP
jgi:spermidine/putrescine transport system substrate-binding protein